MNYKKLIVATLVTGFGMWVVAGLWHNLILPAFSEMVYAKHEGIWIMLAAYLVLALFMAYMFPIGYKGGSPIREGLRFGVLIGILWVFPHELALSGVHDGKSILYVLKNGAWHMIEQGIGGMILGFIYLRLKALDLKKNNS